LNYFHQKAGEDPQSAAAIRAIYRSFQFVFLSFCYGGELLELIIFCNCLAFDFLNSNFFRGDARFQSCKILSQHWQSIASVLAGLGMFDFDAHTM
jgi:hypothetical protein